MVYFIYCIRLLAKTHLVCNISRLDKENISHPRRDACRCRTKRGSTHYDRTLRLKLVPPPSHSYRLRDSSYISSAKLHSSHDKKTKRRVRIQLSSPWLSLPRKRAPPNQTPPPPPKRPQERHATVVADRRRRPRRRSCDTAPRCRPILRPVRAGGTGVRVQRRNIR